MKKRIKILFLTVILLTFHTLRTYSQLVSDFKVNDDTTAGSQTRGNIGIDAEGNFFICWDDRRSGLNVYCQKYTFNAVPIGYNFVINEDNGFAYNSCIAMRDNGNFAVCFYQNQHLKIRLLNSDGVYITDDIVFNDTPLVLFSRPSIGVDRLGNYIVTWTNKSGSENLDLVYYQRFDSSGNRIGSNIRVNDDPGNKGHLNSGITVRQDRSFIICWEDSRPPANNGVEDIYLQMYDSTGTPIGANRKVNDDIDTMNTQINPVISSDFIGNFIIIWPDSRNDFLESELFGQAYDKMGIKIGNNFRLDNSKNGINSRELSKRSDGFYVVGWNQDVSFVDVPYFRRFDTSDMSIGSSYLVTSQFASSDKIYTDIKLFRNKVFSVWIDSRNGNFDIYCNIRSFSNPDTTVKINYTSNIIPSDFQLFQNYPNPFNPKTVIKYKLAAGSFASLKVFDLLGKEVAVLVNEKQNAGSYSVEWDASSLPSGAYIYKMSITSDNGKEVFTDRKKLVLVK